MLLWYTNPMSPKHISFIVSLALLLTPGVAHAYVSPEEVLYSPEFTPPPTSRGAEERVEAQRNAAAAHRAAQLETLHGAAGSDANEDGITGLDPDFTDIQEILEFLRQQENDVTPDPTQYGSAPDEEAIPVDEENELTRRERLVERVADRIERNADQAIYQQLHGAAPMETLHSGAPLSRTGPGLLLVGTALLAGAGLTLRRPGKAMTER